MFGAADAQVYIVQGRDAELTAIASASAGTEGVGLGLTTLLAGLACWGCLVVGIPAVGAGRLDGTELAVITLVPLAAFELVVGLPVATQALQRVRQSAARVFGVIDMPDPVPEPVDAVPVPLHPAGIDVVGLWAGYPDAAGPALRGVDLSIGVGTRMAIVGPSGAGKSSLASVLLRFLTWQAGSLTLDGTSIDRMSSDDLRTVIGLVGQDAYLFDASIAENLRLARRDATEAELVDVVARVGLADWLRGLPLGLATQVGRHGARLSGGQGQRLAVARALLADFPVLVFDEPAEHLDPAAADALTADLLEVTEGRTVVLITHRLTGLEAVDEILVMDGGRVIERGTHDELLDGGGRYSHLWWEEMKVERHAASLEVPPRVAPSRNHAAQPTATRPDGGPTDRSNHR